MEISYSSKQLTPTEVAPGIYMSLPATATFGGVEINGSPYDIGMKLAMTDDGVRPISVTVTAQPGSPPVTGTTMRAVRVWDLARHVIAMGLHQGERGSDGVTRVYSFPADLSDDERERLRLRGPTDETLGWVAFFYNAGLVLGLPPAQRVAIELGLPRTTATKWIRRARDKGLIAAREVS